jgi:hypothetical protein
MGHMLLLILGTHTNILKNQKKLEKQKKLKKFKKIIYIYKTSEILVEKVLV